MRVCTSTVLICQRVFEVVVLFDEVKNVEVLLVWTISCPNIVGCAEGEGCGMRHAQIQG